MRITQIMLSRGFGGAERSFVDMALALAARGHEVQAICRAGFSKKHLLENIPHLHLETIRVGGEQDFLMPGRIASLIEKFGSEVLHTQLKRAAWHGGRAAHREGIPVVSKLHNYVTLHRYKYVHTLVATTEDQHQYALNKGWPVDRVRVIPNFSRVSPVEQVRARTDAPIRIISYGRLVHKKGFDLLLKAFRAVLDSGVQAELILGGDGLDRAKLRGLCEKLALDESVRFVGWIDDVQKALDRADLFVLPSRDEPFGIVMLEAMARGVPIVSTRSQGPSQVLSEKTAFFADIDSAEALTAALLAALENPERADRKAAAALELYRSTYHENAVLPQMEELYRTLVEAGRSTRSVIELHDDLIFAGGGRRHCFLHPVDSGWCIKTLSERGDPAARRRSAVWYKRPRPLSMFDDNLRELESFHELEKLGEEVWEHFPRCFGMHPTTRGRGIVTQLIRDEDGSVSQNLRDYVKEHGKTMALRAALEPFFALLRCRVVLTRDILDHNLVVRTHADELTIFMIDGFGSSDAFPFSSWSKRIGLRKVNRKIRKFCHRYGF